MIRSGINACVRFSGPGPASEVWQGLPGPGGGSRELSQGSGTSGQLGAQGGGQGPKAGHQEHGQMRNRAGKTIRTVFLVSLPPVLLLQFPIYPLLE